MPFSRVLGKDKRASTSDSANSNDEAKRNAAVEKLKAIAIPSDPVEFIEQAYTPIMTWNPKRDDVTLDDLKTHHIPRFFAQNYVHRHNITVFDSIDSWFKRMASARELVIRKSRMRLLHSRIDTLQRQSMQDACIGINMEYVVDTHHHEDTIRVPGMGIFVIQHGKITQGTIVMDMASLRAEDPEVACVVM